MSVTVMSQSEETTTALTRLGNVSHPIAGREKTADRANPVHEDKEDEGSVGAFVNYDSDSSDEVGGEPALRTRTLTGPALGEGQFPLEKPALSGALTVEQQALRIEPTMALAPEPSSHLDEKQD
jgi:hypothetical protein